MYDHEPTSNELVTNKEMISHLNDKLSDFLLAGELRGDGLYNDIELEELGYTAQVSSYLNNVIHKECPSYIPDDDKPYVHKILLQNKRSIIDIQVTRTSDQRGIMAFLILKPSSHREDDMMTLGVPSLLKSKGLLSQENCDNAIVIVSDYRPQSDGGHKVVEQISQYPILETIYNKLV